MSGETLRAGARSLAAAAACTALLALAPATGHAALVTIGSDLSATANIAEARQGDTAYWQTTFADGRSPVAPADGQIRSFKIKGIALSNPLAGVAGGETMFHLQALRARADGTFLILRTSQAFYLPEKGADPQTVTTFEPTNFCVERGDALAFNTVGGWDGVAGGNGPYPMGTPLQIFARVTGAVVSEFEGVDKTNNGDVITPSSARTSDHELLMQLTVGSGPDATGLCPGGTLESSGQTPGTTQPGGTPSTSTPAVQKATLPAKQRVTVSKKGKMSISVFCTPGSSRCVGRVRVMTRGAKPKSLGSAAFSVAARSTGHPNVFLNKLGRRLFAKNKGRLAVQLVAETQPGGASRRSTLLTTLRRRGS